MKLEFPYQLIAFIDKEPKIGEPVYSGAEGDVDKYKDNTFIFNRICLLKDINDEDSQVNEYFNIQQL